MSLPLPSSLEIFCRVETAEAGIGRRQQPVAIVELDADVARAAVRETAVVERLAEFGYLFA